ncbi:MULTISPECIES: hypothetical protein [Nostoc cyanobionts]|uniref:hypothetical protein n=1 Tax=Nostoc cyanobionts TaxID=3123326 RepID=UPI0015E3CD79|nr:MULTISPECIES: hypothetical protein [unclassified Nostoc]
MASDNTIVKSQMSDRICLNSCKGVDPFRSYLATTLISNLLIRAEKVWWHCLI